MAYKKYTLQEYPMPSLGKDLKKYFKENRTRKGTLSKIMGKHRSSIMRYQKQDDLWCSILWHLSLGLNHNFFADLAAQLPTDFTTHAPDPTLALQEELKQLREENKLLAAKLEELRNAFAKR
jgi:hypothetical protein